jgi:hypothetical protein
MHCKNLCKKDSFLATDATTQSSNQEENERKIYFILLQNNAMRKNDDKKKTKRMKIKLWLKAHIAKGIRAQKCKKQSRKHQFQHLPKNHKTNIFSLLSFLSKHQLNNPG